MKSSENEGQGSGDGGRGGGEVMGGRGWRRTERMPREMRLCMLWGGHGYGEGVEVPGFFWGGGRGRGKEKNGVLVFRLGVPVGSGTVKPDPIKFE